MRHIIVIVLVGLIAACNGEFGSRKPSTSEVVCSQGDLDCYLASLTLRTDNLNESIPLTLLKYKFLEEVREGAPEISPTIRNLSFADSKSARPIILKWKDPQGSTPAFCLTLCAHGACSSSKCTQAKPDGLVSGTWHTWIQYAAGPAGGSSMTDTFDLQIRPISPAKAQPNQDPIGILQGTPDKAPPPNNIFVGKPWVIKNFIGGNKPVSKNEPKPDINPGSGKDGAACSSKEQCGSSQLCISNRVCTLSALSEGCKCNSSSTEGVCAPVQICSKNNQSCTEGKVCCSAHTCVQGKCEPDASTQCALGGS